ncbi:MAG TPA: DUF3105 domain-containing protein [Polyangiaceae bacterium]|nr:DUF3105 domain-containing protein [Polyangiaceae bacterium]
MFIRRSPFNSSFGFNGLAALGLQLLIVGAVPACTATTSSSESTGGQSSQAPSGGSTSVHSSAGSASGGTAHGSGGGSSGGMNGGANSLAGTGGTALAQGGANNDGGIAGDNAGPSNADASLPNQGTGGSSSVIDAGACVATEATHPSEGALHVPECTAVSYNTNPPSSGNHYPIWAAFGVYQFPLPKGFWVHNLEHGAVVFLYNCPDGCAAELAGLTTWFNNLPIDGACVNSTTAPRALLIPDPDLDVRFAATAWQNTLKADCFDEAAFGAFYQAHVGNGLEVVCSSGQDFRGPDGMPTAALPVDCGK